MTFTRSPGDRRSRIWSGLTDATILLAPIVTCFVAWALVSYVIVGQPFEQFTSRYGNSALIAQSHVKAIHISARAVHEAHGIFYLGPALPIIVVAALLVAAYRRDAQIWVLAAMLGGCLAFTMGSYLINAIFPWYRYYIMVVPIEVLLVGFLFADPVRIRRASLTDSHSGTAAETPGAHPEGLYFGSPDSNVERRRRGKAIVGAIVACIVALALLVPSIPGALKGMDNPTIAPDIDLYVGYIFHKHLNATDRQAKVAYAAIESISSYFDTHHLPNGDVVVDTGDNCIPNVVTNVKNPRVFVITNDRDFQQVLDDPLTFNAHYLLVQGAGSSQTDAVGLQYPDLSKVSWAHLAHTFPARGYCVAFHLYKVTGHPQGTY